MGTVVQKLAIQVFTLELVIFTIGLWQMLNMIKLIQQRPLLRPKLQRSQQQRLQKRRPEQKRSQQQLVGFLIFQPKKRRLNLIIIALTVQFIMEILVMVRDIYESFKIIFNRKFIL
jgi:hypothetical protein